MAVLNYHRAPALLISIIIFVAVAVGYMGLYISFKIVGMKIKEISNKIMYSNMFNFCTFLFGCYIAGFFLICTILGASFNGAVMGYLSTYYFTIVLFTFVLLQINPYFINIFENTIGYLFLQFFPKGSWSPFTFNLDLDISPKGDANKEFLITVMDILREDTWLKEAGKELSDEIKKCLYAKHFVGHFVWVYFACLICTFTIIKTMAYQP